MSDIGYSFDLYASFDGTHQYHPFPQAGQNRIYLKDLPRHRDLLRAVFLEPRSLDPLVRAKHVTTQVAKTLAVLAQVLEKQHAPDVVSPFLIRCLFTMFAEDVGLLPDHLFTRALEERWIPSPQSFPAGIEALWRTMDAGGDFGFAGRIPHFNGGLFHSAYALPLGREDLTELHRAALADWSEVEPSIFGTLIERALSDSERHKLGAHYTPRAYVERLVRPTIEEPLREEWAAVQADVKLILEKQQGDPDKQSKAAVAAVEAFLRRLTEVTVLDPACGTGNFLYVTFDVLKRLEGEVLALLRALKGDQLAITFGSDATTQLRVHPRQLLGLEIKPFAKVIAEVVLWIGYLQWHKRAFGNVAPPEPILTHDEMIRCQDAVLAWDAKELVRDEQGRPVTRWDGVSTKKHPVTGEDVPDESKQVELWKYVNPRKAEWPKADFIVGNPPFLGKLKAVTALGEGYVSALRAAFPELPDSVDLAAYWWHGAAEEVRRGRSIRFGMVTTSRMFQGFNKRVVDAVLEQKPAVSIAYALPDHPWVDSEDAAAVRIAMTVLRLGVESGIREDASGDFDGMSYQTRAGKIGADLRIGVDLAGSGSLLANSGIASPGVEVHGQGFVLKGEVAKEMGWIAKPRGPLRQYVIGRDLIAGRTSGVVIDLDGLSESEIRSNHPSIYQWVLERVKPERMVNRERSRRENWWLFARRNVVMRRAIAGCSKYLATVLTARQRAFVFIPGDVMPDQTIVAIGLDDGYFLGVLSSAIHATWALTAGSRLGVGNDPRYTKTRCFDPFPFPDATEPQRARIRDLGEALDAHRKRQQAQHPDLTITGMYNVLEKLRKPEALTAKDKVIHDQGLVSVLRQLHDDLDAAVADAYGWPADLSDEGILERLVALNKERAEEERRGLVRWLRPEFQNPGGVQAHGGQQGTLDVDDDAGESAPAAALAEAWPKDALKRLAIVRAAVAASGPEGATLGSVAARFKGAKPKDVGAMLDTLVSLGSFVAWEEGAGRRYRTVGG